MSSDLPPRLRLRASLLLGLLAGTISGVASGLYVGLDDGLRSGLVFGVVFGVVFGTGMGWFLGREHAAMRAAHPDLSRAELRHATRAAGRGSAPDDPRIRDAALTRARRYRDRLLRITPLWILGCGAAILAAVVAAVLLTSAWWVVALVFGIVLCLLPVARRRWGVRVRVLSGTGAGR